MKWRKNTQASLKPLFSSTNLRTTETWNPTLETKFSPRSKYPPG